MSNIMNEPTKVIKLREVTVQMEQEEKENTTIHAEEEKIRLKMEITELEQRVKSLQEKSEQILADLKENIQQEKESWKIEKENERKQAQEKGYEEGLEKGKETALKQYENLLQQANNMVEKATEDYHRTLEKYQQAIITLAIKAAEKILTREIAADETYVTAIIRKALDDLQDHSNISLHVSPMDYELIMNQKPELESSIQDDEMLSIYIDTKLKEGDCIISHSFGQIDISLDTQLQQIKHALEEKITENE